MYNTNFLFQRRQNKCSYTHSSCRVIFASAGRFEQRNWLISRSLTFIRWTVEEDLHANTSWLGECKGAGLHRSTPRELSGVWSLTQHVLLYLYVNGQQSYTVSKRGFWNKSVCLCTACPYLIETPKHLNTNEFPYNFYCIPLYSDILFYSTVS